MNRRLVLTLSLIFFMSTLSIAFEIRTTNASGIIYIRSNGDVDPPTTSILRSGDLYTFTANINDSIVVQRSNIIIDGVYYLLKGNGTGSGFSLTSVNNVTIKNVNIRDFDFGIYLQSASNNKVQGNNITDNNYGVGFFSSNSNTVSNNNVTNNNYAFWFTSSSSNTLTVNVINSNTYSIYVTGAELAHFTQSIDTSNFVNEKPVYYLVSQRDAVINPVTHPQIGFLALVDSDNITAEDLTLTNDYQGLLLAYSTNSKIRRNMLESNYYGLRVFSASYNAFSRNNITQNVIGVNLDSSSNYNIVTENRIVVNNNGIALYGSSNYNTLSGNNITGNGAGVYIDDSSRNTVQGNSIMANSIYGINLLAASNNTISRNFLARNELGVWLTSSSNYNSISRNTIAESISNGIEFSESSNYNNISRNSVTKNTVGIYLDYFSNSSNFFANNITDNDVGIGLGEAGNDRFFHNNLRDNTLQVEVFVSGFANIWDDGYPSGGNYWSDYAGTDNNGDGIGDSPYFIDPDNQDRYPFMDPYIEIPPDTTPPTIVIVSPENTTYEARGITLTFTVSESTSWIGYSLDGRANATIMGNVTISDLSNGSHNVVVYATDLYENTGNSNTVYFTIEIVSPDASPPSIVVLSPENRIYDVTDIPLTLAINESVTWIAYSLNSKPNVTVTGNTTLNGLPDGTYSIRVYALDTPGNTGASQTRFFGVKTATPDSEPEPFPSTWIVVAASVIAIVATAVLIYFKKVRKPSKKS